MKYSIKDELHSYKLNYVGIVEVNSLEIYIDVLLRLCCGSEAIASDPQHSLETRDEWILVALTELKDVIQKTNG